MIFSLVLSFAQATDKFITNTPTVGDFGLVQNGSTTSILVENCCGMEVLLFHLFSTRRNVD